MQRQRQNSNGAHVPYQKRRVITYKPNDYFESFDMSQQEIIINYEKNAQAHLAKSLSIFIDNIRKSSKPLEPQPTSPKSKKAESKDILKSMTKKLPNFKKKFAQTIFEEDETSNPEKEIEQIIVFEKTGKKVDKSIKQMKFELKEKELSSNPIQQKKYMKLEESLKKLSILGPQKNLQQQMENISHYGNRGMTEDTNLLEPDASIKKKSIAELILLSDTDKKKRESSPPSSQDSEYQVTDHSSNESSNEEGDYEERFAFDNDIKPLFGNIFAVDGKNYKPVKQGAPKFPSCSSDSISQPLPKLNFKPLLDSPKKSKSKKKRVYVNKKKVPRWADDLNNVAKLYKSESQRNLRCHFGNIFGICTVQNMQTNPIFNLHDNYVRASTARWNQSFDN